MTEHRSRHRRDARAPDRGPDPGLSRAMVVAALTDVALFLRRLEQGAATRAMPAIRAGLNLPTTLWETLDPATKDTDRFSRGTPLSLRLERLSRFDENNGDRESP